MDAPRFFTDRLARDIWIARLKRKEVSHQVARVLKWLRPGLKVKRWFVLSAAGALVFGVSGAYLLSDSEFAPRWFGFVGSGVGLLAMLFGLIMTIRSLLEAVSPPSQRELVDVVFQRRHLQKGMKIVAIGGGTGLSTFLQGMKAYTHNMTAVVTVADDGGSSGRLREEFGILPPGDIRNCLVALADAEPLMQRLFQHRFVEGSGLRGHSFGNLFIAVLTQMTGDFKYAIQAASRVLAIRGNVVPSTYAKVRLVAEHDDGSITSGESKISEALRLIRRLWLEPNDPIPSSEALSAIEEADVIVIGPGSLFTSVIPNLLVPGLMEAIVHSLALKVYVCNIMTQFRETHGLSASGHVEALIAHTHPQIFQACVVNTALVPEPLLSMYEAEQAFQVVPDIDRIQALGYPVVTEDLINANDYVRHDPEKLARLISQLAKPRAEFLLQRFNDTTAAFSLSTHVLSNGNSNGSFHHEDALAVGGSR
ncbi:MAG: YvcK family protein [Candidatus Omnitrophica bacterium]|nr:YvcK family protein [Candidatus Omnitrophota bacterium]MBI2173924.1 YvcK family protein [Candidatus Omnitrophota bacterium]MBI3010761.1 YvcK family protein [Candidatus Omnitrophota bacterium]